jgi:hypothetical protein
MNLVNEDRYLKLDHSIIIGSRYFNKAYTLYQNSCYLLKKIIAQSNKTMPDASFMSN